MRTVAVALILAACGPKVAMKSSPFEEDDPRAGTPLATGTNEPTREVTPRETAGWDKRTEAPAGKGLRTGVIDRTRLLVVLDAGPGQFLRQLDVTSSLDGDRFVGWQLVQLLDDQSPLHDLDITAGDVLIALNGSPLSRPDQLMTAWDGLRTADKLTCDLLRGPMRFQLEFTIEPPIGRVPPDLQKPAAPAPAQVQAPTAAKP